MSIRKFAWLSTFSLILAACGGGAGDPGTDATLPPETTTSSTSTSTISGGEQVPSELIELATGDLARHLGVDEFEIEVISAESVTWPDGSLGCPEPGKSYTQALVEGGRIVLGYGEKVYIYHYGDNTQPILCKNPDSKDGSYAFIPPPGDDEK